MWCYDSATQVLVFVMPQGIVFAIKRNDLLALDYKADVVAMHRLPRPQAVLQQLQTMR